MSSQTGWTLWSSRSTRTWPFPAPLCPSRTSRYTLPLPTSSPQTRLLMSSNGPCIVDSMQYHHLATWGQNEVHDSVGAVPSPHCQCYDVLRRLTNIWITFVVNSWYNIVIFMQSCSSYLLSLCVSYSMFVFLLVSFLLVSSLWPWQQCGLHWDVPDYDQKRCHHSAGRVWHTVAHMVKACVSKYTALPSQHISYILSFSVI